MSRKALVLLTALLVAGFGVAGVLSPGPKSTAAEPRLSGPYTHDNLTIYLLHGPDQIKDKTYLTLDEALEKKKVIVHETKNVNELSIENLSDDEVFIASGDIVKGGDQDRVLAYDMVVPAHSGKMPLNAFCVEAGRWRQRGGEANVSFNSCKDQLAGKDLRLAARHKSAQDAVWAEVANSQKNLARNLAASVQDPQSASSLQLTLENKKVLSAVEDYLRQLRPAAERDSDVIGFAFAINGKINTIDRYASSALFKKLWPKLLKASAVEAVAEKKEGSFAVVTPAEVRLFMAEAEKGEIKETTTAKGMKQLQCENAKCVQFKTVDEKRKGISLRANASAF